MSLLTRCFFFDETGFNIHTSQNFGYSLVNTKAFSISKANKGVNQSLMCVVDINGIILNEICNGS
jgi:hypothetical protein